MPAPEQLFGDARLTLLALLYASLRIQIALAVVPLFSKAVVPALVRLSLGAALALPLLPPMLPGLVFPDAVALAATVLKECLLGLLIGYLVAALFWAVEGIGFLIDNQRGASIASTLNPLTGNDSSPLGMLFNQAFLLYFLVAGGFGVFMTMLYGSFSLWPVLTFMPRLGGAGALLFGHCFAQVTALALLLAAPALVAMLLAELGLALVSRFTPQLQVFFLAMPLKSGIALFVLIVYLPTLFEQLQAQIGALAGVTALLAPGVR